MNKRHDILGAFDTIEDHYSTGSVFNDSDEEERYQAFKARLMDELVSRSSGYVYEINGQRLNGAPLMEREVVPGNSHD